jgi:hypothetical protein
MMVHWFLVEFALHEHRDLQEVKSQMTHFENLCLQFTDIYIVLESSFVMHYIFVLTLDQHVLLVSSWERYYWQRLASNQRTWSTSHCDLHAPVCMFWLIKFSLYISVAICITGVIQKETVSVLMTVLVSRLTVFNKASYTFINFWFLLIPSRLVSFVLIVHGYIRTV